MSFDELRAAGPGRRRRRRPARRPGGSRGRPRRGPCSTTSSMRPGWIRPSAMSFVIARRATSRRTGSKPDRTTVSGVSSMIRSTPVACSRARMLRPSRPMMRPFISSLGRWTTADGVLGRVVRGDALHRGDDDLAGLVVGLLAGAALDRPGELDGVVLGLLADGLEQDPLGVLGGQAGDALEGGDALLAEAPELLALVLDVALAVVDLAALLLEHVRPLVELLVPGEEAPLEVAGARCAWRGPRPRPRAAGAASRPSPRGSCPSAASGPRRRCGRPCPGRP